MTRRTKAALFTACLLSLLVLTGCADEQQLDARWLARAHANIIVPEVEQYFRWVILLGLPCLVLAGIAWIRSQYAMAIQWFLLMIFGVGSFLRIADVIQVLGEIAWPEVYTVSAVRSWMGWQLPFPEDVIWTSTFAYIFTDIIPSIYFIWKWLLLAVHAAMILAIVFTRTFRPLLVEGAFIFTWMTSPGILGIITFVTASTKRMSLNTATKAAVEVFYVGFGSVIPLIWCLIIPGIVLMFALVVPMARGTLEPRWGPEKNTNRRLRDMVLALGHALNLVDVNELGAFFASFLAEAPPPHRNGEGGQWREDSEFPRLLPGYGPDEFGPSAPRLPSPPGTSPSGETGPAGPNIIDMDETSKGRFTPRQTPIRLGGPTNTDAPSDQEFEPSQPKSPKKTSRKFAPDSKDIGRAAKTVGPMVTPFRPEVGLALSAAGELLDRGDEEDEGENEFSPTKQRPPSESIPSSRTSDRSSKRVGRGDEFPPSSRKKRSSSLKAAEEARSNDGEGDEFPQSRRRRS